MYTSQLDPRYGYESKHHAGMRSSFPEDFEEEPCFVCGLLPCLAAGHLICFLVIFEGVMVVSNTEGPDRFTPGMFTDLVNASGHPDTAYVLLRILGWGDLVLALMATAGLYLTKNPIPSFIAQLIDPTISQAQVARVLFGSFLAWRTFVTLATGPCIGVTVAFDPFHSESMLRTLGTFLYLALNVYLLWILVFVHQMVMRESWIVQERISMEATSERNRLVAHAAHCKQDAYDQGFEVPEPGDPLYAGALGNQPLVFSCLPLEPVVAVYIISLLAVCIWWLTNLLLNKTSSGGWAFLTKLPEQSTTLWLEVCLYSLTIIGAAVAIGAIIISRRGKSDLHYEEEALKLKKRCNMAVLVFFIINMMRFTFFIPVTGMVVVSKNLCGWYVRVMAGLAIDRAQYSVGAPLHCTQEDWITLGLIFGTLLFDGYLVHGVLRLWQTYRVDSQLLRRNPTFGPTAAHFNGNANERLQKHPQDATAAYYGTGDPFLPPAQPVWVQ